VKQAIDRVWQPIEARVAMNWLPRKQTLIDAARQWRDLVPEFSRLKLLIDLQPKRLVVMDMRLSKIAMNLEGWLPASELRRLL